MEPVMTAGLTRQDSSGPPVPSLEQAPPNCARRSDGSFLMERTQYIQVTALADRIDSAPGSTHPAADESARSVLHRAFTLLNAFTAQKPMLTLGELAERADLPRSTTHRLATMLVKLGALQRRGNLGYAIGARMFDVGLLAPTRSRLLTAAEPYLQQLREVTRATVHLAGWSGNVPICLDKISQPGDHLPPSRPGSTIPLHASALGKTLLAFSTGRVFEAARDHSLRRFTPYTLTGLGPLMRDIASIKDSRIGRDNEEAAPGISCIATPILDQHGECLATISVGMPTPRLRVRAMEQSLLRAAESIARAHNQAYVA